MAFDETNGGTGMYMPVAPAYGGGYGNNGGFGGDWAWIIILLLCGWGGMMGLGYDFPWILNGQNQITSSTAAGFDHAATQSQLGNIQTALTSGFGDMQTALCGGFAGVNATVNGAQNALAQQLYTNQISDLERSFAAQTASTQGMNAIQAQLAQCCCDNRAATADLKYTLATEACSTRANSTANTQAILDKLCQLELDGVKGQLAQAQRENVALQNAVNMATMQASQVAQTSDIVDQTYNRLKNCPVNSTPVYGNVPIFTCNSASPCGCGGNGLFAA